jgi:hypothetical protein
MLPVPYETTISADGKLLEYSSCDQALLPLPGRVQCVYIMTHPDIVDAMADLFERWFAQRPEVSIADIGTTDKAGAGFIVLEWREAQVEPLFLAILDNDENVGDYTLYGRSL